VNAKSDCSRQIQQWYHQAKNKQGKPLKEIHSDGGGEFTSTELREFYAAEGIYQTTTMQNTPEHNGRAERKGRTIMESCKAMLYHANAPLELWGEAVKTATFVRNLAGIKANRDKTPNQLWHGDGSDTMKESLKHLRVFGCDAWVHIPEDYRTKLEAKARKCIFLGYDDSGVGYRFYHVDSATIVRSADADFEEKSFTQCAELRRMLLIQDTDAPQKISEADFQKELDHLFDEEDMELGIALSQSMDEATAVSASSTSAPPLPSAAAPAAAPVATDPESDDETRECECAG
jgi:hypothetical protein